MPPYARWGVLHVEGASLEGVRREAGPAAPGVFQLPPDALFFLEEAGFFRAIGLELEGQRRLTADEARAAARHARALSWPAGPVTVKRGDLEARSRGERLARIAAQLAEFLEAADGPLVARL